MSSETVPPGAPAHLDHPAKLDYLAIQASPEFVRLKHRLRNIVLPLTVGFILWYVLFVLLSAFAPGFMSIPVWGNINVGFVMGFTEFATTMLIVGTYVRAMARHVDPGVDNLRNRYDGPRR